MMDIISSMFWKLLYIIYMFLINLYYAILECFLKHVFFLSIKFPSFHFAITQFSCNNAPQFFGTDGSQISSLIMDTLYMVELHLVHHSRGHLKMTY